jgi:alkylation response protein AidB-like acyl-CoA dehydrogenase
VPKRQGISYFVIDMRQEGITPRPLPHIGGEVEFFQVYIDGARVPDAHRVGDVGNGWRVAQATLSGERQMVSGAGSAGVDRVGGGSATHLVRLARARSAEGLPGGWSDTTVRNRILSLWCEEKVRSWTNQRVRDNLRNNLAPGPESSIGKVDGADLNQRVQSAAAELLGMSGIAWAGDPAEFEDYARTMPAEVKGMLRSRANTIEGGTSEVNKDVLAERALRMPKEPNPYLPRG